MLKLIRAFFKRKPKSWPKFKGSITHISCIVTVDVSKSYHRLHDGQPHIDPSWWTAGTTIEAAEIFSSKGFISKFSIEKTFDDGVFLTLRLRKRFSWLETYEQPVITINKKNGDLLINGQPYYDLRGTLQLRITRTCTPEEIESFKAFS